MRTTTMATTLNCRCHFLYLKSLYWFFVTFISFTTLWQIQEGFGQRLSNFLVFWWLVLTDSCATTTSFNNINPHTVCTLPPTLKTLSHENTIHFMQSASLLCCSLQQLKSFAFPARLMQAQWSLGDYCLQILAPNV